MVVVTEKKGETQHAEMCLIAYVFFGRKIERLRKLTQETRFLFLFQIACMRKRNQTSSFPFDLIKRGSSFPYYYTSPNISVFKTSNKEISENES